MHAFPERVTEDECLRTRCNRGLRGLDQSVMRHNSLPLSLVMRRGDTTASCDLFVVVDDCFGVGLVARIARRGTVVPKAANIYDSAATLPGFGPFLRSGK